MSCGTRRRWSFTNMLWCTLKLWHRKLPLNLWLQTIWLGTKLPVNQNFSLIHVPFRNGVFLNTCSTVSLSRQNMMSEASPVARVTHRKRACLTYILVLYIRYMYVARCVRVILSSSKISVCNICTAIMIYILSEVVSEQPAVFPL